MAKGRKRPFPWWLKTRRGYTRYINSPEWEAFRVDYYRRHDKRCFVADCGSTESIRLHHISYRSVGNERDSDVVPLCKAHHIAVHERIRQGAPLHTAHLGLHGAPG